MEYWWKENKRFALTAGGGLLGVLVWYLFIIGPINGSADEASKKLRNDRIMLQARLAQGVPADDAVGRADRDRKALLDDIKELQAATEFKVEDAYRWSESGVRQPAEQLGRARSDLVRMLDAKCSQRRFPQIQPTLGMPSNLTSVNDAVAIEWLRRLAMLKHICLMAIEHGEKLELLETVPNSMQDESLIHDKRFLNKLSMKFRLTASEKGLIQFVHALQQRGSFLAIEGFATQPIEQSRGSLQVEMVVSGLFTNPGEEITPPERRE